MSKIAHYSKTGVLMASTAYEYDKAGSPTKVRLDDGLQYKGDANVYYYYDSCHRLTRENCAPDGGASRFAFDYRYEYDAVGNMTRRIQTNPWYTNREERMYYSPRNELTSIQDPYPGSNYWRFEYDMRGNLTKKYHTYYTSSWYTYAWDAQDRLTKVVNNPSSKTVELKYDLYGRRAAKRVDTGSGFGAWRWYFYDGLKVVAEGTGTADRIYYTNTPGDVGGIICRDQNGTTTHTYHYDRLGNVLAVTNGAGELAAVYESTAFDYALWAFGSSGFNQTIANPQPYHLTTKELDPDTGLYYFNARWYDKHVQRFVSRTVMPVYVEHPYVFCEGNPMRYVDPTGLHSTFAECIKEAFDDFSADIQRAQTHLEEFDRWAEIQYNEAQIAAALITSACVAGCSTYKEKRVILMCVCGCEAAGTAALAYNWKSYKDLLKRGQEIFQQELKDDRRRKETAIKRCENEYNCKFVPGTRY